MAHLDVSEAGTARWAKASARRPTVWQMAVALLVVATLAAFLPLRFTASATLAFDVGTQPPAAAVRGVAQLLASRELAYEAAARLPAADQARLAEPGLAGSLGILGRARADGRPASVGAAWRLMDGFSVSALQGGRVLHLSVAGPTPALALRSAEAYVAAFRALDAQARAAGEETGALPALRQDGAAQVAYVPDPPRTLTLGLLAAAAVGLLLARRRSVAPPEVSGPVDGAELPVQLEGSHRILWLGAPGAGLDPAQAVTRLAAEAGQRSLLIVTSDDMPETAAGCAVAVARSLAQEAGVVLVALDGASHVLGGLVADPWAPGVGELLFGVAGFGETIHRDAASRAHVIPPGRDGRSGPSVVGAERLALVLESLRRTYDHVVVAAPSLCAGRNGQRIAALDPVVVCLGADSAPATVAVESFDALAEQRFAHVVMVSLATGAAPDREEADPVLPPSLEAASSSRIVRPSRAELPLAGAA
ncbi:hypothetical protein V5F49_11390 [Xanthobacter sp. V3C-3]|uniref:hypothetical protein n=1 Tax=Xanthobacter lutulentifluminis TaxID=3119935 RepID=UPI00372B53E1